jgi:ribosome-binding factor A
MLPYKRSQRVSDLLREEVADIIMYISILKDEDKEPTLDILNSAKSFIRSELSKRLRMKFIPTVEFRLDSSIEYGYKIDSLLDDIRKKSEGSS